MGLKFKCGKCGNWAVRDKSYPYRKVNSKFVVADDFVCKGCNLSTSLCICKKIDIKKKKNLYITKKVI